MSSITLFGAGSWGTALSSHLAAADVWGLSVPAPYLRDVAEQLRPYTRDDVTVVSLAKGIEKDSGKTMSQVLDDELEDLPSEQIGALYGPSHSEEVGHERFTSVVAAVATGLSDAAGYGDNVRAALITRGLAEIRRLGHAMGGHTDTFSGLSGVGDLIVTCTNPKSPNRFVGEQLGAGKSLDEVRKAVDGVAAGIPTAQAVHALADTHDLEVPIMSAVYEMLFQDRDPDATIRDLITRPNKRENWLPEDLQEAASKSTFSTPLSQQNGASE